MVYKFKTSPARSRLMQKIKSVKTAPEISLQKALRRAGIKFRKNYPKLPGAPDLVLSEKKVAIFVDGEFWHGYKWKEKKKKIKANRKYWIPKIERNILRDKRANKKLKEQGWEVVRFWEHQIKKGTGKCLKRIYKLMGKNSK